MAKLTKAQMGFLSLLMERPCTADPAYRPAIRLTELGYATRERYRGRLGGFFWVFTITPAGRAALEEARD